jgi:predicted nucleic acid-binding protein
MPQTVQIEPPEVFIDSGGFIALHVPGDTYHQAAITCRDQTLRYSRLYTSSAVIAETMSHIQRDHLLDQQNLYDMIGDFLRPEKWINILPVDDDTLRLSLEMVRDRQDRRFSIVDALNIALMEKHKIDIIFSFDALYDGVTLQRGYGQRFIHRVGPAVD